MNLTAPNLLLWLGVGGVFLWSILAALGSPYLPYRDMTYIIGGFAGIVCLMALLVQPLLMMGG